MSCEKLSPPALPPISGGVSFPAISIPAFSGGVDLCCQMNFGAYVNVPSGLAIPFLGAALALLDADIATADAYLAALDLVSFTCPLD